MSDQRGLIHLVDALSAVAIIGTLANLLPPLAALAGLIWYVVQIWESKTVQGWVRGPPSATEKTLQKAQVGVDKLSSDISKLSAASGDLDSKE